MRRPAENDSEDRELALRARLGCLSDFEELVRRYETRVFSFVAMQCRNRADAQELTQDTFVKAWQALHSWRDTLPFKTWLFTIARRKSIDHYRSRRDDSGVEQETPVDDNTPAEQVARQEDAQALWTSARQLLPKDQFHGLWLRYVEDMEISQIATALGKSRTHTKVLLFRARVTLASRLGRAWRATGETPLSNDAKLGAAVSGAAKFV